MTERMLIETVDLSPADVKGVLDAYESNLDAMASAARAAGTPLFLLSVASNWRWRGRDDLPPGWQEELLGPGGAADPRAALAVLEGRLAAAAPKERHEWLFRRAVLREQLGDVAGARADYRAALEEDPHLRRALEAGNARVRAVAARHGLPLVDVADALARSAPGGIIGFETFYDYVHFTPAGAVRVAAEIFHALAAAGRVAPRPGFDLAARVEARLAELEALEADPVAVGDWLGFGSDPARIADRDLWKYERMVEELAKQPDDARARAWHGNAAYFRLDGAAQAERDWQAALAAGGDADALRGNLARLHAEARATHSPDAPR
jgi:hypothetical protein